MSKQMIEARCAVCGTLVAAVEEPQRNAAEYKAALKGKRPRIVLRVPQRCPKCLRAADASVISEKPVVLADIAGVDLQEELARRKAVDKARGIELAKVKTDAAKAEKAAKKAPEKTAKKKAASAPKKRGRGK